MGVHLSRPAQRLLAFLFYCYKADKMDADLNATFDACNTFNTKLKDTITGLIGQNGERKAEIEALRGDHETLKGEHEALVVTTERENDLRKNEIKSLEEKQQKDNTARITDTAKLEGKLDTENAARKEEIKAVDVWAKAENDSRKAEIAEIKNFAKTENEARKADIAAICAKHDEEVTARGAEDAALSERISTEVSEREAANADLLSRMDSHNDARIVDVDDLKTKMVQENQYLKSLSTKTLGCYFDAYRTKAYDGGGEENLTFQGTNCNTGGGLDIDTGIFTCPIGGCYMFQFHIATHDNKKALLSIRKNGEEIASIFDQNHKDNHKNSMAGQNIIMDVKRGDEIVVN